MRNRLSALLLVGFAMLTACQPERITPETAPEPAAAAAPGPIITRRPAYRGIYINDFYPTSLLTPILGNATAENTCLNWVVTSGFGNIALYDVRDALNAGQSAALAAFVQKARSAPYYLKVSFVTAGTTSLNQQIAYYNTSTVTAIQKQQAFTTEYEFWNGTNNFNSYLTLLNTMTTFTATTTSPAVTREAYVSQFVDASGVWTNPTDIAKEIVLRSDRIFLVHYAASAWNLNATLTSKLQTLANGAAAANKVIPVVILFNVNTASTDPNIYNYFSVTGLNHYWDDAYNNVRSQYNSSAITNKSFLNLQGYQIYRYSNAILARP